MKNLKNIRRIFKKNEINGIKYLKDDYFKKNLPIDNNK